MKGKAITLPHRRSYRVVALAQSGSICIFQQHYRAKAKKGRGTLAPAFCLFALKTRASTSVVTSRKQCAIANVSPADKCACANFIEGGGFLNKLSIRSMRCLDCGHSSTAYIGGGPASVPSVEVRS